MFVKALLMNGIQKEELPEVSLALQPVLTTGQHGPQIISFIEIIKASY
jgi:hypothetical protein